MRIFSELLAVNIQPAPLSFLESIEFIIDTRITLSLNELNAFFCAQVFENVLERATYTFACENTSTSCTVTSSRCNVNALLWVTSSRMWWNGRSFEVLVKWWYHSGCRSAKTYLELHSGVLASPRNAAHRPYIHTKSIGQILHAPWNNNNMNWTSRVHKINTHYNFHLIGNSHINSKLAQWTFFSHHWTGFRVKSEVIVQVCVATGGISHWPDQISDSFYLIGQQNKMDSFTLLVSPIWIFPIQSERKQSQVSRTNLTTHQIAQFFRAYFFSIPVHSVFAFDIAFVRIARVGSKSLIRVVLFPLFWLECKQL